MMLILMCIPGFPTFLPSGTWRHIWGEASPPPGRTAQGEEGGSFCIILRQYFEQSVQFVQNMAVLEDPNFAHSREDPISI